MSDQEYQFVESKYQHRKVFSQKFKGTGIVMGEDKQQHAFLIEHGDAEQVVLKEGQFKFKAIDDKYRERYVVNNDIKTASGAASINNGDAIAEALLGVPVESLRSVAKENGFMERFDEWMSRGLNPGLVRMNTGSVLRGKANHGIDIFAFGNPIAEEMVTAGREKMAAKKEKDAAKRLAKKKEKDAAKRLAKKKK